MKDAVDLICAELKRLELPTSLASSTELRMIIYDEAQEQADSRVSSGKSMRFEPLTFARYNKYAEYLVTRLKDELSTKTVMTFPLNKVGYFDGSKIRFRSMLETIFHLPTMTWTRLANVLHWGDTLHLYSIKCESWKWA